MIDRPRTSELALAVEAFDRDNSSRYHQRILENLEAILGRESKAGASQRENASTQLAEFGFNSDTLDQQVKALDDSIREGGLKPDTKLFNLLFDDVKARLAIAKPEYL